LAQSPGAHHSQVKKKKKIKKGDFIISIWKIIFIEKYS